MPSAARRRSAGIIVLALAALAVAWVMVPPHSVPLYDGINFPDEPYRYVAPPAGTKHTPAATTAVGSSPARAGTNVHPFYTNSAENAPQISVFVNPGTLALPADATSVTLTATPLAPDVQPPGARADGNVYRITAAARVESGVTGPIVLPADPRSADNTVTLRATTARQPRPTFYFRAHPTDSWQSLDTVRVGTDIYRTPLNGFGDYVLAFTTAAHAGGGSDTTLITLAAAGGILAVFGGVIVTVRLRRHRGRP